jgi:ketosteroid isomerase-like protein
MTSTETIAAITEVVNTYATAMVAGDCAELERVFFENACVFPP